MHKYILILLGLFSLISESNSQTSVKATVDSANTYIGSRVIIELSIAVEADTKYIFPEINDTINRLIVINRSLIDTNLSGTNKTLSQKIYLTAFDSGSYTFPSLTFFAQKNAGMPIPLYSNPIDLNFKNVDISKMKDIGGIKPIYTIEKHWYDYIWYYLAVFLIISAIVIAYIVYKKRKKPLEIIDNKHRSIPNINSYEFAFSNLQELRDKQYWATKEYKLHFTLLTDTIRRYIEIKYRIPALESVSYELLNDYLLKTDNQKAYKILADIFAVSDIVKFAKFIPSDEQSINCLTKAFEFIKLNEDASNLILKEDAKK